MFLYSLWLNVPFETRMKIAKEFNIPKKGHTEVSMDKVVRDGYDISDIDAALTPEALKTYIGPTSSDLSASDLWLAFIDKAEDKTLSPKTPLQIEEERILNATAAPLAQAAQDVTPPVAPEPVKEESKTLYDLKKDITTVTPPIKHAKGKKSKQK